MEKKSNIFKVIGGLIGYIFASSFLVLCTTACIALCVKLWGFILG